MTEPMVCELGLDLGHPCSQCRARPEAFTSKWVIDGLRHLLDVYGGLHAQAAGHAIEEIERLARERNVLDIDVEREKRIAEHLREERDRLQKRVAELEGFNVGLATESEWRRVALETALRCLQGALGPGFKIEPLAQDALSGEPAAKMQPDETKHAQAPIARITIRDGYIVSTRTYSPSLPDGEHDLYCEPEAVAPMMREETADCSTGLGGVTLEQMAENIKHGRDPYLEADEIRDLACCDKFVRESASEFCATCGYTNLDHLRKRSAQNG